VRFEPLSDSSSDARSVAVYIDFAEKAYSRCAADVLETIIDSTSDPILLFDSKGKILRANQLFLEVMKIQDDKNNLVGKHVMDIFPAEYRDSRRAHVEYVLNEKKTLCVEVEYAGKAGMAHLIPVFDESGEVDLILVLTQDITHTYALKRKEDIINSMASELDETSVAIRRVTKIMEKEQADLKAEIQNNININIKPLLQKLRNASTCDEKTILLLDAAIDHVVSDALGNIGAMQNVKLTLTENRVCQLIKNGHKIREIAEILNLADDTVKNHRKNIRRKLGLRHKDINLRTYLETYPNSGHA
jgi:PAS domain S-box-containing protein